MIFLAPPLEDYIERAAEAVDAAFEIRRKRPAGQQSMDALKVFEAQKVAAGGTSPLLEAEAQIRGITVEQQAERILHVVKEAANLELDRIALKDAIRKAGSHAQVAAILKANDIPFVVPGTPTLTA